MKNLEETVSTQRVALDGKLKQAKENSKAAEAQVAVFRAELVQIKKEKSKLSAKLKVVEDENAQFKKNTAVLKQEVKDLEKEVIHKTKLQEADRKIFEREKESFKKRIEKSKNSLKHSNTQTENFKCEVCELVSPSESNLADHSKSNHKETSESFSQTIEIQPKSKPFVQYPCFYCGIIIQSESHLLEHFKKCEISGETKKENDEDNATKMYQALSKIFQLQVTTRFPCDICPETFEFDSMLEMHMMFKHPS